MTPAYLAGLVQQVWLCPPGRAALHAPFLREAMLYADITTPLRLAHFLAQSGHETGRGRWLREIWGPTAQQLRYEPGTTLAATLGNVRPGDGLRYLGRGGIHTTGRANYRALTNRLRKRLGETVPDFEAAPALLEGAEWAWLGLADYWQMRKLNETADANNVLMSTRRVNGGQNGLADRQALTTRALQVFGVLQ
jgi:putative chitinase